MGAEYFMRTASKGYHSPQGYQFCMYTNHVWGGEEEAGACYGVKTETIKSTAVVTTGSIQGGVDCMEPFVV